jgi:hypothetical protein
MELSIAHHKLFPVNSGALLDVMNQGYTLNEKQ